MPFIVANLILLLLSLLIYSHFRVGVYSYCRLSKMSKTNIRKNKKGLRKTSRDLQNLYRGKQRIRLSLFSYDRTTNAV